MQETDVVVIGAGIVGASVAAQLAQRDHEVAIVERDGVGAGASGRNAGSIIFPPDPYFIRLCDETLARYAQLAESSRGAFSGVANTGVLAVSHDVSLAARLTEHLRANRPELEADLLEPAQAGSLEPELASGVAACRSPAAYTIDPAAATLALVEEARSAGAQFHIGFDAELWIEGDRLRGVKDGETVIAADRVVVCAGLGTTAIVQAIAPSIGISPVWGVIAELSLPRPPTHIMLEAESQLSLVDPAYRAPEPDIEGDAEIGFGFITVGDVSGLGHSMSKTRPERDAVIPRLVRLAATFLPRVAEARIRASLVAARPASPDDKPILGRLEPFPNCFVAAGHGGRGVTIGPATARLLVDFIEGAGDIPPEMSADRFGSRHD